MMRVLASVIVSFGVAAPATAAEPTLNTSLQASGVSAPQRGDTPINPGGDLLDVSRRDAELAARLSARWEAGSFLLLGDVWLQTRRDLHRDTTQTSLVVPEAYASWSATSAATLLGGVNVFKWGTGYIWNPSNPFADIHTNNTSRARSYRRDGDPFAAVEYTSASGDAYSLHLVDLRQTDPLLARNNERSTWAALRYQTIFDSSDLTATLASSGKERFVGAATSATIGDKLELHGELGLRNTRHAPRIGMVQIGPPGTPQLPVWSFDECREWTTSALLGGQYTFENGSNLILEYFYNGNGLSDRQFDQLADAASDARSLAADATFGGAAQGFLLESNRLTGRMRRHYAFARVARDDLFAKIDAHLFLRWGVADRSYVAGWMLRRAFDERFSVALSGEHYGGPTASEAKLIPVSGRYELALTYSF